MAVAGGKIKSGAEGKGRREETRGEERRVRNDANSLPEHTCQFKACVTGDFSVSQSDEA
jgi:hypothetical protein